jgi:hypothetical protein
MTMYRWDMTLFDGMKRMVGGRFVLAADAEAAIAAAEQRGRNAAWADEASTYRDHYEDGYTTGQQDMLAKCIAAVEAITYGTGMGWLDGEWLARQETLTALRALKEKP